MNKQEDDRPENCLEGMECPNCGQYESFVILGYIPAFRSNGWVTVYDDGTEQDVGGDFEFDSRSPCECPGCGLGGSVSQFTLEKKHAT